MHTVKKFRCIVYLEVLILALRPAALGRPDCNNC